MGKTKMEWQDIDYVLGYFGRSKGKARKEYESFVKAGLNQGRREELIAKKGNYFLEIEVV